MKCSTTSFVEPRGLSGTKGAVGKDIIVLLGKPAGRKQNSAGDNNFLV